MADNLIHQACHTSMPGLSMNWPCFIFEFSGIMVDNENRKLGVCDLCSESVFRLISRYPRLVQLPIFRLPLYNLKFTIPRPPLPILSVHLLRESNQKGGSNSLQPAVRPPFVVLLLLMRHAMINFPPNQILILFLNDEQR